MLMIIIWPFQFNYNTVTQSGEKTVTLTNFTTINYTNKNANKKTTGKWKPQKEGSSGCVIMKDHTLRFTNSFIIGKSKQRTHYSSFINKHLTTKSQARLSQIKTLTLRKRNIDRKNW